MQERKARGLCMFCEEQFTPGHQLKHRRTQIYVMECDEEVDDEVEKEPDVAEIESLHLEELEDAPLISVVAMSGSASYNCMRVIGQYGKKLHILIDSGSTHNFIDISMAKLLGCKMEAITPMWVKAANGNRMQSSYRCPNFSFSLQGYELPADVRTLPLDCGDLVLGIQWLTVIGPVWWDFVNMRMEFKFNGLKHVIRGEPEEILERKMVKRANGVATKVLIKWKGFPAEKATWEFYQDFISKFPSFDP
ncbi:hypothetical protein V2J09_005505 [Rumex salicifolius]